MEVAKVEVDRYAAKEALREYREHKTMTPSDIDKIWAAGFFEGEGSVRIGTNGSNRTFGQMVCEVSQVDEEPTAFLQARWGGNIYWPGAEGRQRPYTRWVVYTSAAVVFLNDIRRFIVRTAVRDKIALALEFQAQKTHTHENRTPEYRARQEWFITRMSILNRRGATEIERAVMANRIGAA